MLTFSFNNEIEVLQNIRKLLSYLPPNNLDDVPIIEYAAHSIKQNQDLNDIIPKDPNKPYDMHEIIQPIVDHDSFFEVHADYACNLIVGFARMDGRSVGIVANQPANLAGVLDIDSSIKGARFIRFCDAFNIPIITFEDVPGFLPGTNQEWQGIIKHGAKLLYAYAEATVPKLTIITRKAYGGAYIVMDSMGLGADKLFAWPSAEIAVMGAEGAVDIINRRDLQSAENKEELKSKLVNEYNDKFSNPDIAAKLGLVDKIIKPSDTRKIVVEAFKELSNKTNLGDKHGNIPL